MPAKFTVADETRDDRTAEVFADKSLRTRSEFTYYSVPSATATAAISTGGGMLHSVIFGASAAGSKFWLFDSAGTANDIGDTASAVARFEGGSGNNQFTFNSILNSGLTYRLSAAVTDGITVIYKKN